MSMIFPTQQTTMTEICACCKKKRRAIKRGFCVICRQTDACAKMLEHIASELKPASSYNRHLFDLFFSNVKRYRPSNSFVWEAKILKKILEKKPLPAILSWAQIYALRKQYGPKKSSRGSHPMHRIGHMLQEIGVIEPRSEMRERRLSNLYARFDDATRPIIIEFSVAIRKMGRTEDAVFHNVWYLCALYEWLIHRGRGGLLTISSADMQQYLSHAASKTISTEVCRHTFYFLHRFYRWCLSRKKILFDPLHGLEPPPMPPRRHVICSEKDLHLLGAFIKSPASSPDLAFLLSLVLFWGLTMKELCRAQLGEYDECFEILFLKTSTTRRNTARRPEKLMLPQTPLWFVILQKRYLAKWHDAYALTKKAFPGRPLFLHPQGQHNRPLSHMWFRKKIAEATKLATGTVICPFILRQTCGFLHTKGRDAGVLQELGWSSQAAFTYTWAPYRFYAGERRRIHRRNES